MLFDTLRSKIMTAQERNLKLIWDFRGPDGARTAEHHVIHLKEYIKNHNVSRNITGVEAMNENHSIAFMVVKEAEMPKVRDDLKPHRGQVYIEKE